MKKNKRPAWLDFWFTQALMYSTRGTCDRLRVACIIVKNNRLVGAGYNGSPRGTPHCDEIGHLMIENHCERTLHGEENAIINTQRADLEGATAYVVATPCIRCAKMLVNSGVKEINCLAKYDNSRGKEYLKDLFKRTGVKFIQHNIDPKKLIDEAIKRLEGKGGALWNQK